MAMAQSLDASLGAELQRWTLDRADAAQPRPGARVEVALGQLDPRLKLAPCNQIDPYLPAGSRPWGRTRVGLRCTSGPTRWNVFLPVTVQVWAPALVLREPLPAGTELNADHLTEAEVDWAERPAAPLADAGAVVGRTLLRPLAAGDALRDTDLRRSVWFNAGDRIKVTALGPGYRVSTEGQALSRGVDGQTVRVRTVGGRIVSGTAVANREVEILL
jgi:flagella basal body P-ring formation protein FlgA